MARQSRQPSNGLGAKFEVCPTVMNAPSPPLRRPRGIYGARQVSWLTAYRRRRLPRPMKSPVARKRRHAAHSRGGGHGSTKKPTVFPFHPRAQSRDRTGFMSQLREGLSNGAESARRAANYLPAQAWEFPSRQVPNIERRPAWTSEGRSSSGWGARASRPEQGSQLPQCRNPGFRDDGAQTPGGTFTLGRKIICAEQRFGESALHFALQQRGHLAGDGPWQSRPGRTTKPAAKSHQVGSAHDGWRANGERGEASEELTPRDNKRPHLRNPQALADDFTA
jgi:hypothetical protein